MDMELLNLILADAEYHGENAGKLDGSHGVLTTTNRHLGLDWTYQYVANLIGRHDPYVWETLSPSEQADYVDAYLRAYGDAYLASWETELDAFLAA